MNIFRKGFITQCVRINQFFSHILLFGYILFASPANAAFYGATIGPDDLPETIKTPWYYTSWDYGCYESQESIALAYINGRIGGRVCDSQYVDNDPDYSTDPLAGRQVDIPDCAPRDAYNIPNQNAIPLIRQFAQFNFLTQIVPSGSTCPGGSWYSESRGMTRESFEYCPRGYGIRINNDAPSEFFCQLQNPIEDSGELCGGNPISIGTGNKHQVELDFVDTHKGHLRLERHYNNYTWGSPGQFGSNWTSTFEREIGYNGSNPDLVNVKRENGIFYQYIKQPDDSWQSNTDTRETLIETPSGWTYTTTEDETETYDVAGQLHTIEYIDGTILTLGYNADGVLETVTSNTGESLFYYEDPADTDELVDSVTVDTGVGSTRVWKYTYDSNNNLEYVISPDDTPGTDTDNPIRQYFYEDANYKYALTGIMDERGIRYATFEYSTATSEGGNVNKSYHGSSANPIETVTVNYHTDSHAGDNVALRTVTNSKGEDTVYQTTHINGKALPTNITGPGCSTCSNGGVTTFTYHPNSTNLFQKTKNNVITEYGNYDSNGNPGYMIEAQGTSEERRTDYTYDFRYFSKIATQTEPSVHPGSDKVTTFGYDDFGNQTAVTVSGFTPAGTAVSRTTTYQYNGPWHQISQIDGPRTDITDITILRYWPFDEQAQTHGPNDGRLKEIEDATGTLIRSNIQYTATGKVASESRPNGLTLTYTYYFGNDRLETLIESDGTNSQTSRWTYLATGEVETITTADGTPDATTLTFSYDDARRLTRITDGLGNYIEYTLDTEGNRIAENTYDSADVLNKTLTQTFDVYNRLDVSTQANETVDADFAPDGMLAQQTDGNGYVTDFSYDALKRLLSSTQDLGGLGALTQYDYDVGNRLTEVINPNSGTTTYQYDDLGNLLQAVSPDTGTVSYTYDAAGNLKSMQDAKGQLFLYSYDALNRLTSTDAPGSNDDITYSYDICTNGVGRLCSVVTGAATVSYAYDSFGNVTTHQGVSYTYDLANRIKTLTYPSGAILTYDYDAAGQVSDVDLGQVQSLASNITYAPFGGIEALSYGNGQTLNQQWDTAYRLLDQSLPGILSLDYPVYDMNGNLKQRDDSTTTPVDTSTYTYDALNRLDTANGPFGNGWDYGYDLNGNRTLSNEGTSVALNYEANSNRLDTIGTADVILDVAGNTLTKGNWTYTYTPHHRLATANDGSGVVATFAYNGLGQRVSKTLAGGGTVRFVYGSDGALLAETDAAGTALKEYVYLNGVPLAMLDHDADNDGVQDASDNCIGTPNGPLIPDAGGNSQYDTNGDGYGNICDPDFNNNGLVDPFDYSLVKSLLGSPTAPDQDLNGNGIVDPSDTSRTMSYLGQPPGPSGPNGAASPAPIYFIHNDHLGTPQVMTDATGAVVWKAAYDPFGKAVVDEDPDANGTLVTLNVRFPGQYYDQETGLHYNWHRYQDPETGRYLTSDPIGLLGGLNTYTYALNNPIVLYDPYGLWVPPSLPQGFVDFSAGLGDALLIGQGQRLRDLAGIDGGVDKCSDAYDYGSYTALAAGGGRLAYAGLAKTGSLLASSGVQASAFREGLKTFFRGGVGRNWRPPNLAGKTDAQLRASAGKTNFGVNAYGAGVAGAAAVCGCEQ